MTKWVPGDAIPEGEGRCFEVDGKHVAIVHHEGRYYRLEGACPIVEAQREGMPVQEIIDQCPRHDWHFDIANGNCQYTATVVSELDEIPTQARFWEAGPETEVKLG